MTTAGNLTITTQTVAANGTWSATSGAEQLGRGPDHHRHRLGQRQRLDHLHGERRPQRGPTSGTVGTTGVTLSGTGYTAGKTVATSNVTYDRRQPHHHDPTVAANGTWSGHLHRAEQLGRSKTITATDSGSDSASTTFTVNPTPSVAPTSGTVGTTGVTLTGTGYIAGKTVATSNVSIRPPATSPSRPRPSPPTAPGAATFTVPNSYRRIPDHHRYRLRQPTGPRPPSRSTPPPPPPPPPSALSVAPTSGTVGHDRRHPERHRLDGRQDGGHQQRVHRRSALTITTQTVASNGTWSPTFTVPNSSAGGPNHHPTDSGSDSASTTFTVNAAPQPWHPPTARWSHRRAP